jgi:hypothetical protein
VLVDTIPCPTVEERGAARQRHSELAARQPEEWVTLNVGGQHFATTKALLSSAPNSYFAKIFSGEVHVDTGPKGELMLDRDGEYFRVILNFLRDARLPKKLREDAREDLAAEARFYGFGNLLRALQPEENFY